MRIGHGYDAHRLVPGRRLVLGGVDVPGEMGLLGHSDADVLTHALMDALLGAAALGDIGILFPPGDAAWKDAVSTELLAIVVSRLGAEGFRVHNCDCTVIAQAPRLAPYIPAMREKLASVLGLPPGRVSVKATTEEHMGFTGAGEGMAAHAVVLLDEV